MKRNPTHPMDDLSAECDLLKREVRRLRKCLRMIWDTPKGYQDLCWEYASYALRGKPAPKVKR